MAARNWIVMGWICVIASCGGGGCAAAHAPSPPAPHGSTYLIHLPGIGGDSPFDRWWMDALLKGGAADRADLYDWTCREPGIGALQATARNHREAQKVADLIVARLRSDPTAKVVLTAESGGTGVAVWALEKLPRRVKVDALVLVAPAISPGYDLSLALRHVRRRAYYFTSPGDWVVLGVGTRLFGTMDGPKTDAAGLVGFREPPAAVDPSQYRKLTHEPYETAWIRWGNWGTHTGGMSPDFAQHVVAPLIRDDQGPDAARALAPGPTLG